MNMTKLTLALVCSTLLLGATHAQDGANKEAMQQMQQKKEEMLDKLGLTAEQKEKFKAVEKENRESMAGLRDKPQEERRAAYQKAQDDFFAKLKEQKIMTDEQIAKYKELRQEMMKGMAGKAKAKTQ